MGKFKGVLLASDFDNTLIYTEPALRSGAPVPELSERNRAALTYFIEEGGRFAIATGRAPAAFQAYADHVPMNAPAVVCNGAMLYDFAQEEILDAALLDREAMERAQILLEQFPAVAAEAYHVDNMIYAVQPNVYTRRHERLIRVGTAEAASLQEVPAPLGKLLFEGERDQLEAVLAEWTARGWDYGFVFSGRNLLEMTARGASKGGMLCRLAARLGISMEHVYSVGDEANDLSMLLAAAEGFAPANCIEAVRRSGVTIVSHAEQDALADVVGILDRKYPPAYRRFGEFF